MRMCEEFTLTLLRVRWTGNTPRSAGVETEQEILGAQLAKDPGRAALAQTRDAGVDLQCEVAVLHTETRSKPREPKHGPVVRRAVETEKLVLSKFGSGNRFEPEPDRTERKVQVQVRQSAEPEPEVQFGVRKIGNSAERIRTAFERRTRLSDFTTKKSFPAWDISIHKQFGSTLLDLYTSDGAIVHIVSLSGLVGAYWLLVPPISVEVRFSVRTSSNAEPNAMNLNLGFRFGVRRIARTKRKFRFGVRRKRART
ncbi:hypothetical protein C8R44DRAFT_753099 [Mycena epipterygia]|nr:hypothetical protein C8R44DRAFT_753099 [Mycena epipterygia]